MVSCFPAVEYAELFYRQLEIDKTLALKETKGNFDAHMTLSDRARSDIKWWIENCQISKRAISHGKTTPSRLWHDTMLSAKLDTT